VVARYAVSCDVYSSNRQRYASASAIFGSFALVVPPLLVKERILSDLLAAFPTGTAAAATPGASAGPVASDAEASASETTGTGAVKWFLASVAAAVILGAAFVVPVVDPSGCSVLSLNPDKHYQAGLNYKQLNEWGDAAQSFTKAIACDSGRVDALVERGLAHRVLGRPEEAILDFQGALTAGATPSDFSDYYYLGFSYLHLAELGEGVYNLSLSLWAFDRAIATNSDDADSYVNRGIARRHLAIIDPEQMTLLDAIGDFDRAIKLDPIDADAFANRGIAYRYQGKREESLADIARSVEISGDPSSPYSFDQEYWKQLIDPTGGQTYQPVLPPSDQAIPLR